MHRYHDLLLSVWREACRHIEIADSTATIAAVIGERLPLDRIIVRRLDLQRAHLETVASQAADGKPFAFPARTELASMQLKTLVTWGGLQHVARQSDPQDRSLLRLMAPRRPNSEVFAGPLHGADGLAGVLILMTPRSATSDVQYESLLGALLEPFSAALENDRRLHEMKTLREAAEAEQRALLRRLGRTKLTTAIVGSDGGLRPVLERVEVVCASDLPVLLLGETGTGKEVIARVIHDRSPRQAGPFIRVNCGAIPSELIDSQLFGHERGSFTGAVDTHQGWFERADGGTLFLDEIGELPLAAQVRLLRVLQDGFIERVGGGLSIHVDVRIVAATHRNLAAMVRDNQFREDLWYRVAVFPIPIPPLRERTEDIQALACHLAEKAATRFGLPLVMPTPEDLRLLARYSWPGNIRELAAVIDRAALLGNGRALEIATSLGVTGSSEAPRRPETMTSSYDTLNTLAADPRDPPTPAEGLSLNDAMRRHIETALRLCHGRVEGPFGAAKRLNINPHTLRSRVRKLGIDARSFRQQA